MKNGQSRRDVPKRHVLSQGGYEVYAVDAFAVRNISKVDEEFTHFATYRDFEGLIPEGEVWVSESLLATEGLYFVANAIAQLRRAEAGVPDETAYEAGLNVERILRRRLDGARYRGGRPHKRVPQAVYVEDYLTLPDSKFAIEVWRIDGGVVRSLYKTDYTEGGHGYVYPWVPKGQIWVEAALHRAELPFILAHEYLELRLMRDDGMDYDPAHETCVKVEFDLRRGKGIHRLLTRGRERPTKPDLPRLTAPEVFEHVLKHYRK